MIQQTQEIALLAKALVAFQLEVENATKGSTNPAFKSKYADLAEVLNVTRPVLAKHGISVQQHPTFEDGTVRLETVLLHESGQAMSSVLVIPVTKQDAQGVGSAITYARRYALASICGIAQEDDDANAAVKPTGGQQKAQQPTWELPDLEVFEATLERAYNAFKAGIDDPLEAREKYNKFAARCKARKSEPARPVLAEMAEYVAKLEEAAAKKHTTAREPAA